MTVDRRRARVRRMAAKRPAPRAEIEIIVTREPDPSVTAWLVDKLLEILQRN